jgi:tetratricopeptide (TPR) repeat protein
MRKIAVTVFALAMAFCGFAQKKNVSGAEAKLYEPMDLAGAKSMIESAMKDPTTTNQAKTYWVAGEVFYKIYEDNDTKRQLGKDFDQKELGEGLMKAVDAYKKCYELELLPNEKGKVKQKYSKQIPDKIANMAKYLVNAGLTDFNGKNYAAATDLWKKYIDIADYPFMAKANLKADTLYNEIKYYTINAASQAEGKEAIAQKYMEDLKGVEKYSQTMYEWLFSSFQKQGNQEKVVATLQEAVSKFPSNQYFIGSLINYYLDNKKDAEAIAYVDEAIAKDPKNPQYYLIKAQLFVRQEAFSKAIDMSKKAIELDAENYDANFYCGFSYVKKAESAMDKANNIKNDAKHKQAKRLAIEEFKKAIPYLEKARSINPKDASNLNLLRTSYYRAGNGEMYNKIDKELKALQ